MNKKKGQPFLKAPTASIGQTKTGQPFQENPVSSYCKERWDFSRRYAYYLINAASVVENVNYSSQKPMTETQARPLINLIVQEKIDLL